MENPSHNLFKVTLWDLCNAEHFYSCIFYTHSGIYHIMGTKNCLLLYLKSGDIIRSLFCLYTDQLFFTTHTSVIIASAYTFRDISVGTVYTLSKKSIPWFAHMEELLKVLHFVKP